MAELTPGRDLSADQVGTGIEHLLAVILNWGVFLSAGVILLGLLLLFVGPAYGGPEYLTSLPSIWAGLWQGNPNAIMMGGMLLLLVTPVIRVVAAVAAFAVRRERWHVLISISVLLILLASMAAGQGH